MAYRIAGLDPAPLRPLFGLPDEALTARGVRRVTADRKPGFPCRVTLEDAEPGERLILVNHASQPADTPFRATHAIYVRDGAREPATFRDELPPLLATRTLSLRGFDQDGMLRDSDLAAPGEAEPVILTWLARPEIAEIHAHSAAAGCFIARIVRD